MESTQQAAKHPKTEKLVKNPRLRAYPQQRLAGAVRCPDGAVPLRPTPPPCTRLNKPHLAGRPWSTAWSPEQISHRLKVDFPDNELLGITPRRSTRHC